MRDNLILQTDSYKLTHHAMLPPGTTRVYSYLEARTGGAHADVLWFGLSYYLKRYMEGVRVTEADVAEARDLQRWHLPG